MLLPLPAFWRDRAARAKIGARDYAAGNDKKLACVDRWIDDASKLIPSTDVSYARTLIGYYPDNYLRDPTERVRSFCTAP